MVITTTSATALTMKPSYVVVVVISLVVHMLSFVFRQFVLYYVISLGIRGIRRWINLIVTCGMLGFVLIGAVKGRVQNL